MVVVYSRTKKAYDSAVNGGYDMSLTEKIIKNVKTLPESKQIEVLDFVEYLRSRAEKEENIEMTS